MGYGFVSWTIADYTGEGDMANRRDARMAIIGKCLRRGRACAAAIALPMVLLLGACSSTKDDPVTDIDRIVNLAEQGDLTAQTALGQAFESGNGVQQNFQHAAEWYEEAGRQGDPLAQFLLAQLLETGALGEPDFRKAAEWYMRGAAQGDASSQAALARLYESGHGVPQDYDSASRWYAMAAIQWDAHRRYPLGKPYDPKRGGPRPDSEALKWYWRAANLGIAEAQYDLGYAYENGHGMPQDLTSAQKWYTEAAEQGHDQAAQALARLYGMAPEQAMQMARAQKAEEAMDDPAMRRLPALENPTMENPTVENPAMDGPAGPMRLLPEATSPAVPTLQAEAANRPRFLIHLASYRQIEDADKGWGELLRRHGDILGGLELAISRVQLPDKGNFFRVQAGPFQSIEQAAAKCRAFTARDAYCKAVPDSG